MIVQIIIQDFFNLKIEIPILLSQLRILFFLILVTWSVVRTILFSHQDRYSLWIHISRLCIFNLRIIYSDHFLRKWREYNSSLDLLTQFQGIQSISTVFTDILVRSIRFLYKNRALFLTANCYEQSAWRSESFSMIYDLYFAMTPIFSWIFSLKTVCKN